MKRGEIWTVAARGAYTGKPRPAVILQDDRFDALGSVTVCIMTSDPTDAPLFRPSIDPDTDNGLERTSRLMADKLTTVPRTSLGERIGRLSDDDILALNRAIVVFLGLV